MNIITISKRRFETLEPLLLEKGVYNTEADLYEFVYRNKPKIVKLLFQQTGAQFGNKLNTLEMLDANKEFIPNNFARPDYLLSVNGHIEGFTMPKIDGINLSVVLKNKDFSLKEKIYYLKKIGEILNQMCLIRKYTPLSDFYLNDIHDSNFLVNPYKGELYVVDLDSSRIGGIPSFPSRFLSPSALLNYAPKKYNINDELKIGYVEADENTDLYCYALIILNFLYGANINDIELSEFYEYLEYLKNIGVNKDLIKCFTYLVINKKNENPVNFLDSLTAEQVCRAKKNVYQLTK